MRRRSRLPALAALAASACTTAPSPDGAAATDDSVSEYGGRFRGELSVYTPLATSNVVGAQPVSLEPGTYPGEIGQFRRGRLEIDLDSSAIDTLTVALDDSAPEFPRRGGRFSFTPAEHNLAYTIAGEYFVEEEDLGSLTFAETCTEVISETICVDVAVESESGSPASSCYLRQTEVYGRQDVMTSSVRRSEDLSVRFLDPQTRDLVALYFGSNEPRVETIETPVGSCQISQ